MRAHPLTDTHTRARARTISHGNLQFLNEHFLAVRYALYPKRGAARYRSRNGVDSSLGWSLLPPLASLPPLPLYVILPPPHSLISSNSLPDRGRGAAVLLRAELRGLDYTQRWWEGGGGSIQPPNNYWEGINMLHISMHNRLNSLILLIGKKWNGSNVFVISIMALQR